MITFDIDNKVFVPSRGISNLNLLHDVYISVMKLFSSPHGAYLISIKILEIYTHGEIKFSSPHGAYLISISNVSPLRIDTHVFVPSRGISNLNFRKNLGVCRIGYTVFVPSRGISNLNREGLFHKLGSILVFVPSRGISNLNVT